MFCDPSAADLQRLLNLSELLGLDAADLLRGTGVDPVLVGVSVRPTAWQYKTLLDRIAAKSPGEVGLWIGAQQVVDGYGEYTPALDCFGSLRHVNAFLRRYHVIFRQYNYYTGTLSQTWAQGEDCVIELAMNVPLGPAGQLLVDELLVRARREMGRRLGVDVPFKRIELRTARANAAYEAEFGCQVRYGAPRNCIVLPKEYLERPISGGDPQRARFWEQLCREHVREIAFSYRLGVALISEFILSPGRVPELTVVAERIGRSSTTLKRWLQSEGGSYHELVDQVRMELFSHYLTLSDLCPKQVAYALGFANVHNLRRFLRRKTGATIPQLRLAFSESWDGAGRRLDDEVGVSVDELGNLG